MFEDKIEALNNSRAKEKKKKAIPAVVSEKTATTSIVSYTPPPPRNNVTQSIDLNMLIKALQVVMYGEQEDYQDIDPSQVQVYTVDEIRHMLGISGPATHKLLESADFPSVKVGKGWKIPKKAFHEWLNNQR